MDEDTSHLNLKLLQGPSQPLLVRARALSSPKASLLDSYNIRKPALQLDIAVPVTNVTRPSGLLHMRLELDSLALQSPPNKPELPPTIPTSCKKHHCSSYEVWINTKQPRPWENGIGLTRISNLLLKSSESGIKSRNHTLTRGSKGVGKSSHSRSHPADSLLYSERMQIPPPARP